MGMYCLLNELTTFKRRSVVKVRVVRSYTVMERRGSSEIKSKELVLHDEEATVIHACIPKDVLPKFPESFLEGNVYCFKNFYVVANWHTYKTSMHEFMLQFNHETIMKESRSDNFPYHMYRPRPFHTLKGNPSLDVKELIDLIGRIVEIHAPQEKPISGQNTVLIDFVLKDTMGSRLNCTFWDEHVAKLEPLYRSASKDPIFIDHIYFIFLDGDVKISSSYDVTQLLIDVDCPEMQNFKESLVDIGEQTPMRSIGSMTSFSFTNSIEDSTSRSMQMTTISEIYENETHGEFWVASKINGIEKSNDWCYTSCRKPGCNKKLKLSEGVLKCFKCNLTWENGVLRYKLRLRVVDMKGTAAFLLWDREFMELIGTFASELYQRNKNTASPLKEITGLIGRIMLFRVSANTNQFINQSYAFPILRINTESKFVQQYCKELLDRADKEVNSTVQLSDGDDEFLQGFDSDEAESPIQMLPPTNNAETSDGPVKRCLLDQFSSTKGCKKLKDIKVKID
ncbi:replication protein A 70 kDa DNA-binding subunit B-like [Ipomoea triloba]|uniref:replication protein A 70 kDa DNA-binding subunit B-like n=1 Tax=Ipomoea triloba TaxID=35885 RepID=UPI00125CDFBC|nr:replication protein A 70 kDa DNA-binding subunit B-like [Ipomoea triloba]